MKKLLFISLFTLFAFNIYAQTVPFTLEITNVRSDKGNIMVAICASENEYLEYAKCKYSFSMPAVKGTMVKNLNIDKGRYAIIVYHDENSNKLLDTAMFGKPKEYYGFSNNVYGAYGTKPEFAKAVVNVDGSTKAVIKLRK